MKILNNYIKYFFLIISIQIFIPKFVFCNTILVDKIIAKVGNQPITLSELETMYIQFKAQNSDYNASKKDILERIIQSKLLINQAIKDGVIISNDRIDHELNGRIDYYIEKLGSADAVEAYFGKSIHNLRIELFKQIKEQIYTEEMSSKIFANIQVTPEEVIAFFNAIPEDEKPYISTEYVLWQIVKIPKPSTEEKNSLKIILLECKLNADKGESFSQIVKDLTEKHNPKKFEHITLSWNIGEYNAPDYEKNILTLSPGQISQPIFTNEGVFLIRVISRDLNVISSESIQFLFEEKDQYIKEAKQELIKIKHEIESKKITFEQACDKYSDNIKDLDNSDILNINGMKFELKDLPIDIIYAIDDKEVTPGTISAPLLSKDEQDMTEVKLIYLKEAIPAHQATLQQDYEKINQLCIISKREAEFNKWLQESKISNEVWIDPSYGINDRF